MTDALDRLKKRNRPEVPRRDPGIPAISDISNNRSVDIQISTLQDVGILEEPTKTTVAQTIHVKQTSLRLEVEINNDLQTLCQSEGFCREVLIESMFMGMLDSPDLREKIIATAHERQKKRVAVANYKRAHTMMQRL